MNIKVLPPERWNYPSSGIFLCYDDGIKIFRRTDAKFTRPFMELMSLIPEKGYCYHVRVIGYALFAERGKAVMKKTNEVSKLVGVSRRTLQYYDDEGVIAAQRTGNNYRVYDRNALEDIWRILLYKEMGFELREIKGLLRATDEEQQTILKSRMEVINRRIDSFALQKEFVSMALSHKLPRSPKGDCETTYVKCIEKIKEKEISKQKEKTVESGGRK